MESQSVPMANVLRTVTSQLVGVLAALALSLAMFVPSVGCTEEPQPLFFRVGVEDCELLAAPRLNGGQPWEGCEIVYAEPTVGITLFTVNGSGPGWLNIVLRSDAAAGDVLAARGGGSLERLRSTAAIVLRGDSSTYTDSTQYYGDSGSVKVNEFDLNRRAHSLAVSLAATAVSLSSPDGSTAELEGDIGILAVYSPTVPEQPSTGGGCNQPACDSYQRQCDGAGKIGPCYCAAACLCACLGDTSCERENLESASSVNASCNY